MGIVNTLLSLYSSDGLDPLAELPDGDPLQDSGYGVEKLCLKDVALILVPNILLPEEYVGALFVDLDLFDILHLLVACRCHHLVGEERGQARGKGDDYDGGGHAGEADAAATHGGNFACSGQP